MSGVDHEARVVSSRVPDDGTLARGETPGMMQVWNWYCSCGTEGHGRFPSRRAAETDHADHMLATLEPEI